MPAPDPAPRPLRAPAPHWEMAIVVGLCFGIFIQWSFQAVSAGFPTSGFDDSALLETVRTELVCGGLALAFLRWRGHSCTAWW